MLLLHNSTQQTNNTQKVVKRNKKNNKIKTKMKQTLKFEYAPTYSQACVIIQLSLNEIDAFIHLTF